MSGSVRWHGAPYKRMMSFARIMNISGGMLTSLTVFYFAQIRFVLNLMLLLPQLPSAGRIGVFLKLYIFT